MRNIHWVNGRQKAKVRCAFPATLREMSLAQVIAEHRVVVTVGSGGVGKTTTAAALALHAAMDGKRVLCLTIDPARRLANSLGLSEMTTSEQTVTKELFEAQGLTLKGELAAMMLDTRRTFDELVTRHASSPEARDRILNNKIYTQVATSLAGTQEYMAMEKLHQVRAEDRWDLIVLDTPPTSNALDFLDAPERLVGVIDSSATRWFITALEKSSGTFSFNLVEAGASYLLKGLAKFTGMEFLEQVAEFLTGLNDLFGGFRERARDVANALRSDEVAFVVVTSPNPLAVKEAIAFEERLRASGMGREAIVVNGVHRLLSEPSADDATLMKHVKELFPELDAERMVERMKRALQDERLQAVADRIEADRLRNRVRKSDAIVVEVPAFERDVHSLGALAQVAHHLTR